ncbi:MAG: tRNA (adenosine(37)-N6)-threonylcarbamoyltransferase complex ATPase subunit type 1 TsaE [Isosphaeraceae bacterium]
MHIKEETNALVIELDDETETVALGRALAGLVRPGVVIGLSGPLGAGKTRLTRAIAEALGVDPEAISSPTFVLIHEYEGRLPVYHFDAYRLGGPKPFEALGATDYWDAGGVCLVEWAELVAEVLPADAWRLILTPTGPTARRVELTGIPSAALRQALGSAPGV